MIFFVFSSWIINEFFKLIWGLQALLLTIILCVTKIEVSSIKISFLVLQRCQQQLNAVNPM